MKFSLVPFLIFPIVAFNCHSSFATTQNKSSLIKLPSDNQLGNGILIDGKSYAELVNLPSELMSSAERAFDQKNFAEASADLQTAAKILRLESIDNDNLESMRQMRSAADGLDQVARRIRLGEIADSQHLLRSLAQAMYFKSNYDRLRAIDAWTAKKMKRAGYDIMASANEIDKASTWSGRKMEKGGDDVIRGALDVAGKLTRGANWSAAEVGRALDHLGVTIVKVGESITPSGQKAIPESTPLDVPASDSPSK